MSLLLKESVVSLLLSYGEKSEQLPILRTEVQNTIVQYYAWRAVTFLGELVAYSGI